MQVYILRVPPFTILVKEKNRKSWINARIYHCDLDVFNFLFKLKDEQSNYVQSSYEIKSIEKWYLNLNNTKYNIESIWVKSKGEANFVYSLFSVKKNTPLSLLKSKEYRICIFLCHMFLLCLLFLTIYKKRELAHRLLETNKGFFVFIQMAMFKVSIHMGLDLWFVQGCYQWEIYIWFDEIHTSIPYNKF